MTCGGHLTRTFGNLGFLRVDVQDLLEIVVYALVDMVKGWIRLDIHSDFRRIQLFFRPTERAPPMFEARRICNTAESCWFRLELIQSRRLQHHFNRSQPVQTLTRHHAPRRVVAATHKVETSLDFLQPLLFLTFKRFDLLSVERTLLIFHLVVLHRVYSVPCTNSVEGIAAEMHELFISLLWVSVHSLPCDIIGFFTYRFSLPNAIELYVL